MVIRQKGLIHLFGHVFSDAAAGDVIWLDGTALAAGNAIDSPGDTGDYIALWAINDTDWFAMGTRGTWIDGGAD